MHTGDPPTEAAAPGVALTVFDKPQFYQLIGVLLA